MIGQPKNNAMKYDAGKYTKEDLDCYIYAKIYPQKVKKRSRQ